MADLAKLGFDVDTGGLRKGQRELKGLSGQAGKTTKSVSNLGRTIRNLAGAIAVGAAFRTIIRSTIEQERVTAQLNQTLRSTGRFTEQLSQGLQDYASELQKVTTFGDEAIISSQALLLTFTRIGDEAFPRAQEAVLDVATAMGTDLKSAAIQVGKALNDPVIGLTALSRSGITFSETQKEMIKDMVKAGDAAGAQAMILDELETQFGGSARAARDTLGGALTSLSNAFGDLLEGDSKGGGVTGTTKAIGDLTDLLSSSEMKAAFGTITESMITLVGIAAQGIQVFVEFGEAVGTTVAEILHGTNDVSLQLADLWNEQYELEQRNQELRDKGFKKYSRDGEIVRKNEQRLLEIEQERTRLMSLRDLMNSGQSSGGQGEEPNIVVSVPVGRTGGGDIPEDGPAGEDDLLEKMERRKEALIASLQTEKQAILAVYGERDAEIAALEDAALLTEMQSSQLRIQNERQMYDALDAMREENLEKERESLAERQEIALSTADSIVSITSAQVSQMDGLLREAGVVGKGFFAVSKALAAANAIINGFQAAMAIRVAYASMAAMSGPGAPAVLAAGEVHAGVAQGMGFATAGLIAAQTLASFDGGGDTGNGPRSGGLDGKGGFLAMMHPRETVIDHTKGADSSSSSTINITQVLQIPGNMQQEAKQQIMAALPLIRSTAIQAVSTEINRGGNMARQVGRRS